MTDRVDELVKAPGTEPFTTEFLREHLDERFTNGGLLFDQWFLSTLGLKFDDEAYDEEYQNGYDEGYQNGYDAGYYEGCASVANQDDEAYDEGYRNGRNDGYADGYEVGFDYGLEVGRDIA